MSRIPAGQRHRACPERVRTTGGAATTGLAALQLRRRYIGIDVNAGFHDEAHRLGPYLPDAADGAS